MICSDRFSFRVLGLGLFLGALLLTACDGGGRVCDTGATQTCVCPSLAMGAQVCTAEGVWGTCSCGVPSDGGVDAGPIADSGTTPDAGMEVDASTNADGGNVCTRFDATDFTMTVMDGSTDGVSLSLRNGDESISFSDQVYFSAGAVEGAQTVTLVAESYATCAHCVLLRTGCEGSVCDTTYLATEGTLTYTTLTDTEIDAVLTDARLIEVTIDSTTFESTPVPGGRTACTDSIAFSGVLTF